MSYLLFDDKNLDIGRILEESPSGIQIETVHGRRQKIKAKMVMMRFEWTDKPAILSTLMVEATKKAEQLDPQFLWDCCGDTPFSFKELSKEYFGDKATVEDDITTLIRLRLSPMYFHRSAPDQFRRASPEILQAALAGMAKRQQQEQEMAGLVEQLIAYRLPTTPDDWHQHWPSILFNKTSPTINSKALNEAAKRLDIKPSELLLRCRAFADWGDYHRHKFLQEDYPNNPHHTPQPSDDKAFAALMAGLPSADAKVYAFSIDDVSTDEVDDALSVTKTDEGWMLGVHIAAPSLLIEAQAHQEPPSHAHGHIETSADKVLRQRMSTVYWPSGKLPMMGEKFVTALALSDEKKSPTWVNLCSLDEGREVPVVSLYIQVVEDSNSRTLMIHSTTSCLERLTIQKNLRLQHVEDIINNTFKLPLVVENKDSSKTTTDEDLTLRQFYAPIPQLPDDENKQCGLALTVLWRFAQEHLDSRAVAQMDREEYRFSVEAGRINISARPRGLPLDNLVAEMMIFTNQLWAKMLRDAKATAIYRVKSEQKAGFTIEAGGHKSMGLECYGWFTSPLRRYVDLCNQRQLIALLSKTPLPYGFMPEDEAWPPEVVYLREVAISANSLHGLYDEYQRRMEKYWCLRWLQQENPRVLVAAVQRLTGYRAAGQNTASPYSQWVRLLAIPLSIKINSPIAEETVFEEDDQKRVLVSMVNIDECELEATGRVVVTA